MHKSVNFIPWCVLFIVVDPVKSRENSPFKTDETAKMIEGSPDHTATKSDSILLPVLYDIDLVVQMVRMLHSIMEFDNNTKG